ncbi:MAG: alpha/beta hydrolase [Chloroflexota bacterium]
MDFVSKLDPELAPVLDTFPPELVTAIGDDPPTARAMFTQMTAAMADMLPPTDVTKEKRVIVGPGGDLEVVIYQPTEEAPRAGLLWMHGGGYIIGSAEDDASCISFAENVGCTVVSVEYRMAPDVTYKESVADCFAALKWMVAHADELGVDKERIAIGGASAGGGLTAALALYNRDHDGVDIAFQWLIYPMIDDTHETASGYEVTHPSVWNRDVSLKAWKMYLGDEYGTDNVSPYGAPFRATDLSGLPPAYVVVGTEDLFRDEDIEYAKRLMAAGVPTELEVYAGMFHGGESFAPMAGISQRMRAGYNAALKRALAKKENIPAT